MCSTVGAVLHVFCYSATTKLLLRPFIPGGCPVLFVEQTGGAWLHWLLYTMAFDLSLICQVRCMLRGNGRRSWRTRRLSAVQNLLEAPNLPKKWMSCKGLHACKSPQVRTPFVCSFSADFFPIPQILDTGRSDKKSSILEARI